MPLKGSGMSKEEQTKAQSKAKKTLRQNIAKEWNEAAKLVGVEGANYGKAATASEAKKREKVSYFYQKGTGDRPLLREDKFDEWLELQKKLPNPVSTALKMEPSTTPLKTPEIKNIPATIKLVGPRKEKIIGVPKYEILPVKKAQAQAEPLPQVIYTKQKTPFRAIKKTGIPTIMYPAEPQTRTTARTIPIGGPPPEYSTEHIPYGEPPPEQPPLRTVRRRPPIPGGPTAPPPIDPNDPFFQDLPTIERPLTEEPAQWGLDTAQLLGTLATAGATLAGYATPAITAAAAAPLLTTAGVIGTAAAAKVAYDYLYPTVEDVKINDSNEIIRFNNTSINDKTPPLHVYTGVPMDGYTDVDMNKRFIEARNKRQNNILKRKVIMNEGETNKMQYEVAIQDRYNKKMEIERRLRHVRGIADGDTMTPNTAIMVNY